MGRFSVGIAVWIVAFALPVAVVNGATEGMAIWTDGSENPPGYALWNGNGFSTFQHMKEIYRYWVIIRGAYSPVRDEAIVMGVTLDKKIAAQIYSGGQWNYIPEIAMGSPSSYTRAFDVQYESRSGNPLIVWSYGRIYEMGYAKWTGSTWVLGKIPTPIRGQQRSGNEEINLKANPKSNEMVLVVDVKGIAECAIVWDGNSWNNAIDLQNNYADDGVTNSNVAYEHQSGRAIVIYPDGTPALKYRIWNGVAWSGEGSASPPSGFQNAITRLTIAADPSTNRIAAAVSSSGDKSNWVTVWDGNTWGSKLQVAPGTVSTTNNIIAVAFEGTSQRALVVYQQRFGENYRTWSSSSGWSEERDAPPRRGPGVYPTALVLYTDNESNNVMLGMHDNAYQAYFSLWDDDGWGGIIQTGWTWTGAFMYQPHFFMWKPARVETEAPTAFPTRHPTPPPSSLPTPGPSIKPTQPPTDAPTQYPTRTPTPLPTMSPTVFEPPVVYETNEGMAIWADGDENPPAYALWDGNVFSASHQMRDTGGAWRVIRGAYSPTLVEAIVLGVNQEDEFVKGQIYSGGQWSDLPFSPQNYWDKRVFTRTTFAVKYESQSGNPLIVWSDGHRRSMKSAKWTGLEWSFQTIETPLPWGFGEHEELEMEASPISNEMVLIVGVRDKYDYAIVWDGESWGNGIDLQNRKYSPAHQGVAYEQHSGRAIIVFEDGSSFLKYRIWNGLTWSEEGSVSPPAEYTSAYYAIKKVAIGADPSTNRIVAAVTTQSYSAFWATVWDGNNTWGSATVIASKSLASHSDLGIDVAFESKSQHALATYTSEGNDVKYRTWSPRSGWSKEGGGPDIGHIPKSVKIFPDIESNDIMMAVSDVDRGAGFCKWSGSGWGEFTRMTNETRSGSSTILPLFYMWKLGTATHAPTTVPTSHPTLLPTPFPTQAPSRPPSPFPIIQPKEATVAPGHSCENNEVCQSNTCRNGVCMATPACYPLRHKFGEPFFEHKVNIVFVASGFDTATKEEWHAHVNRTYKYFENYKMFSTQVEQLNIFRVDPVKMDSSFCAADCLGITRLLCCNQNRALSLSQKCFSLGSNLHTVVIHNDMRYGGGGYTADNIATVTTHAMAPVVAAHELGHSLFDLTDEYTYGTGTDKDPNCDSTRSCDKWSDLIGNTPVGYDRVRCLPGCRNGNFYVGSLSFMNVLSRPMGAVNDRFTCCTYCALTKSFPPYCDVFNPSPNYLFNYCRNNDYQSYGRESYEKEPLLTISALGVQDSSTKYVQIQYPLWVSITSKTKRSGDTIYRSKKIPLDPGMFLRSRVEGDFPNPRMARRKGCDSLFKILVFYRTGKDTLFYCRNTTIEVPMALDPADDDEPLSVSQRAEGIHAVVDTQGQRVKSIRIKVLDLS